MKELSKSLAQRVIEKARCDAIQKALDELEPALEKYEEHFPFDPRAPPPAIAAATTQVEELEAALENMQAKHAISVAIQDATHGSSCDSERAQGRRHAHLDRLLSAIITSEQHKCKWHAVDEGMLEQARQLWKGLTSIADVLQTAM